MYTYLKTKTLPDDPRQAKGIVNMARKSYFLLDDVLYYEQPDRQQKHLRQMVLFEHRGAAYTGHFSVKKIVHHINQYFNWEVMYIRNVLHVSFVHQSVGRVCVRGQPW